MPQTDTAPAARTRDEWLATLRTDARWAEVYEEVFVYRANPAYTLAPECNTQDFCLSNADWRTGEGGDFYLRANLHLLTEYTYANL